MRFFNFVHNRKTKNMQRKVFFGDRYLIIASDIEKLIISEEFNAIHKYSTPNELRQFVEKFNSRSELNNGCIYFHDVEIVWEQFCKLFKQINAAGGLVENGEGKKLIIDRRGYIDLPKGKAEKGETPEQNALREVEEETGLHNLHIISHLADTYHTYPLDGVMALKHTTWFAMKVDGCPDLTPQTEEDIVSAMWVAPSKIKELSKRTYASLRDVFETI